MTEPSIHILIQHERVSKSGLKFTEYAAGCSPETKGTYSTQSHAVTCEKCIEVMYEWCGIPKNGVGNE